MSIKYCCELCGHLVDRAAEMMLQMNGRPVMLRHYCPTCWPKTQFAVECFLKRTAAESVADISAAAESAPSNIA